MRATVLVVASTSLVCLATLTACPSGPDECGERGSTHVYAGSEEYVGSLSSQAEADAAPSSTNDGVFGSTSRIASVDWDPYLSREGSDFSLCDEANVRILVTLAQCSLSARVISDDFDTGRAASEAFISASATVDPGQSCTIPVTGGTATIAIQSGQVTWDDATSMSVVLSGTLTSWPGETTPTGFLTYTFKGVNQS